MRYISIAWSYIAVSGLFVRYEKDRGLSLFVKIQFVRSRMEFGVWNLEFRIKYKFVSVGNKAEFKSITIIYHIDNK